MTALASCAPAVARAPAYESLAEAITTAARKGLPDSVMVHAARGLFNVLGTAAGAAFEPGVDRLVRHEDRARAGAPVCPGRVEQTSAHHAALVVGFAAHYHDYDDAHLATVIHPAAACLGAAWAGAAEAPHVSAHRVLAAVALGCEVQLRLGLAVSPAHYAEGWHITGTCGVIGAAVTAALIHGADTAALARALRAASLLTLGHRQAFGTDLKPLHAGKAASNGLVAARHALRAERMEVLRGQRAALPTLDALLGAFAGDWDAGPLEELGGSWELLHNTFKAHPCGIVAHPGIDAALDLVGVHEVQPQDVERIEYRCHPLVPELMGEADPVTGLAARFSAAHGVATALVHGAAGLDQFSDAAAVDEDVRAVRRVVRLLPDAGLARDAARVTAYLRDGSSRYVAVDHARGSADRPLTDGELVRKVRGLVPVWLPAAEELWDGVRTATVPTEMTGAQLFAPWWGGAR